MPVKLYDPESFTDRFMPSEELKALLKGDLTRFFIVRVEDMYRHVQHAVPASRSVTHSCLYLTEGIASMKIGSSEYTIRKGEMLFVPAGQIFSFREGEVNKGYLCNFHPDVLIGKFGLSQEFEFLQVWGNPKIRPDEVVAHLFQRILFYYTENGLDNIDIIHPYLVTLLCEANRAYQPASMSSNSSAVSITNRFRSLLFSHIRTKHRVADYAALLNITPNHLNKTVKSVTSKPPSRWIDETIVLEAKVLLYQTRLSIGEVAMETGLEDPSYFSRLFRKYEGVTPVQFRKMIEKS